MKIISINSYNQVFQAKRIKSSVTAPSVALASAYLNIKAKNKAENNDKFVKTNSIDDKVIQKENSPKVYILSGSSGVGKDTVLRAFLNKNPDFKLSVSCTTRQIRDGEEDGKDYIFLSEEEFQKGIENGEFLEWAEFSGNKYGTKKESIEENLKNFKNLILKLNTSGALKVKRMIPNAVLIFVAPPSMAELELRLRERKTETEDSIIKRMSEINQEMENAKQYDYKIVNDTVENAVSQLEKIVKL